MNLLRWRDAFALFWLSGEGLARRVVVADFNAAVVAEAELLWYVMSDDGR